MTYRVRFEAYALVQLRGLGLMAMDPAHTVCRYRWPRPHRRAAKAGPGLWLYGSLTDDGLAALRRRWEETA